MCGTWDVWGLGDVELRMCGVWEMWRGRQMNKAWSVRLIGEYLSTLPNPKYTDLADSREIYGDALLTYEPHPGTALYLGYTTDFQNLNPDLCTRESNGLCNPAKPILPTVESSLLDDERVVYMKVNYLFRF